MTAPDQILDRFYVINMAFLSLRSRHLLCETSLASRSEERSLYLQANTCYNKHLLQFLDPPYYYTYQYFTYVSLYHYVIYLQVHLLTMAAIITTMTTMRMIHICIRITEKKRKWYPSTKPLTVQGIKRLGKKSTKEHATQELLVILTHLGISCGSTRFWNNKLFRASSLWSLTWSPLCSKKTFFSLFPFSPKNSDDQGCALAIPGGH